MTKPVNAPDFPPLLTGHVTAGDPGAVALAGLTEGRLGAGDLCWAETAENAELALVLEPEVRRDRALQMVPLMAVAVCDALAHSGPPNIAIGLGWPATFLANGARLGQLELTLPAGTGAEEVPAWMVLTLSLALRLPEALRAAPGRASQRTALHEEGAGDITAPALIGAVARHFLAWYDGWQHEGFGPVAVALFGRLGPDARVAGQRLTGIDESGAAVLEGGARLGLAAAMGVE
ncbi:hypothetical protein U879_20720 [Defluviimonas sp. 20V17]|uniref:Biotin-(Acetyl-CoA carboxylase) ligase n=1 Tax=Allgaiera indica TaxID=765699 RepID=A0AAN4US36_9RHOB|nr:hypothetical protein U879_20720 [Defluviimonas sp. 20V17]GHE02506.1 hypothetical protein GCM10008024_22240 [Allgaiera indica]SDX28827.1 Biotin-(acetyl-CoA carboxylase) ligase [Allgaiera indica]